MRKSKVEAMKKAMEKEAEKIESNPDYGKECFCQIKEEMDEYEREKSEGAKVGVEHSMLWKEKEVQSSF